MKCARILAGPGSLDSREARRRVLIDRQVARGTLPADEAEWLRGVLLPFGSIRDPGLRLVLARGVVTREQALAAQRLLDRPVIAAGSSPVLRRAYGSGPLTE